MNQQIRSLLRGRKLKKLLREQYSPIRKKYGITQLDIELLQYFDEHPGSAASDVIRELQLNKGNVSTALLHLFQEGYVDGESRAKDRRVVEYKLKPKGRKVIRETEVIRRQLLDTLFEGLNDKEWEVLGVVAEKVINNLEQL